MSMRMLIDGTHAEEVRVVVMNGNRLEEYDVETSTKKQLKGNVYLAKVTRVEPSLQAAFVDYGGNRHGFLAFSEIHPDYYQIPIADREALLADEEGLEANARAAQAHVDEIDGGVSEDGDAGSEGGDDSAQPDDDGGVEAGADGGEDIVAFDEDDGGEARDEESSVDAATDENGVDAATDENGVDAAADENDVDAAAEDETATAEEKSERRRRRAYHRYRIQEVIKRRQILLVQVVKEERGNKGAALTTYISLAGRYCVLMPNSARGGGVSRKITNLASRRKLKGILNALEIPEGMGVIMRTAGMERNRSEIKRDFEYLIRAWDEVRELTLKSTAPALVYEEASLIKRAIRDLYAKEIEEVLVDGNEAYQTTKKFMRLLMPSHAKRVLPYRDETIPLFFRYQVEEHLDAMYSPVVQLKSGGYLVVHSTEALVAIDVNSGRSTRERNIEETAFKTNLEAADETARQLRLRDLAGLVVIDFIDMEESRNIRAVEKRMKDAMKSDRARIQIGRISSFGLLEMSRQRLRPSLLEGSTQECIHCAGSGFVRSTESMAMHVLRAIEEEGIRLRSSEVSVAVTTPVALYVLNQKRAALTTIEQRYGFVVTVTGDDTIIPPDIRLERSKARSADEPRTTAVSVERVAAGEMSATAAEDAADAAADAAAEAAAEAENESDEAASEATGEATGDTVTAGEEREGGARRRPRRRRRGRKTGDSDEASAGEETVVEAAPESGEETEAGEAVEAGAEANAEAEAGAEDGDGAPRRRRRGRRGGRRRSRGTEGEALEAGAESGEPSLADAPQPDADMPLDVDLPVNEAPDASLADAPQPDIGQEPELQPEPEPVEAAAPVEPVEPVEMVEEEVESPVVASNGDAVEPEPADEQEAEIPPEVPAEVVADAPRRKGWWNRLSD